MPKVSIIIPVYNVEEYLSACVRSATEQTERNIEIILVDDGSTDESGLLCDRLASEDSRIKVVHKPNGGLSSARNAGVSAAAGAYILLLDGDDRLHPQAARRTLEVMEQTVADLVQFRYREVADAFQPVPEAPGGPATVAESPAELFTCLYQLGGEGASACTKLFRRELLEQIPFEPVRHEDELWCTKAYQRPLKAAYIEDVLYDYVQRPGSIIRGGFSSSRLDILDVCSERMKVLEKLGLPELLGKEYGKLFLAILTLYRDAADAGDARALVQVREAFTLHRDGILTHAAPGGKFGLLFRLMCVDFRAAELYRFYWKIRR